MVARHLAKVDVAGSSPVFCSINMQVSYIGNTPAFQAEKVGSIPTTCSIFVKNWFVINSFFIYKNAPIAQLDRVQDFESWGRRFETY